MSLEPKSYLNDPDVMLMLDFQAGNPQAFEKLMTLHYKRVLNFIYKYVNNREVAEDLTQEVFVKVYKQASKYSPKSKLTTWMLAIAKNLSLNELRRAHYKKNVSLDAPVAGVEGDMQRQIEDTKSLDPAEGLSAQEKKDMIRAAIEELPINQKTAVLLRRFENMSYDEIAQTMGTTPKAVKSLLNRAKENLRQKLESLIN